MIALVCVLAYLTASLYGARHLYGRFRARSIDKTAAKIVAGRPLYEDPVAHFNEWDKGETVAFSVLGAMFWPLALAGFGVYRFVTANPELSRTELTAERGRMAQRIRELECELGIKDTPVSSNLPEKRILDAVSAEGTEWQANAPCVTADFDFIPDVETDEGVNTAQQWCRTCPVRPRCLAWAMLHGAEGYWGGTTTYQRNQLRRVRTRAKCPLCTATSLVYDDPHELCLACGVSWIRDVREEPIAATPLPQTAA